MTMHHRLSFHRRMLSCFPVSLADNFYPAARIPPPPLPVRSSSLVLLPSLTLCLPPRQDEGAVSTSHLCSVSSIYPSLPPELPALFESSQFPATRCVSPNRPELRAYRTCPFPLSPETIVTYGPNQQLWLGSGSLSGVANRFPLPPRTHPLRPPTVILPRMISTPGSSLPRPLHHVSYVTRCLFCLTDVPYVKPHRDVW